MLAPKLFARKISHRSQHLVRRRSGRHREHEFMDQLWRLFPVGAGEGCLTTHVIDVEIPVIQQRLSAPTAQALSVVRFELKLTM